jgi:hypothetical protein
MRLFRRGAEGYETPVLGTVVEGSKSNTLYDGSAVDVTGKSCCGRGGRSIPPDAPKYDGGGNLSAPVL